MAARARIFEPRGSDHLQARGHILELFGDALPDPVFLASGNKKAADGRLFKGIEFLVC